MLTLKFQVPAPNDILLTVVIESHTTQRENKILWRPSGGKKQNRFHTLSVSLSCFYWRNHQNAQNLYIHTHMSAETQMRPPKHLLFCCLS